MTNNKTNHPKTSKILDENVRQAADLIAAVLRRIQEKRNSNKETA